MKFDVIFEKILDVISPFQSMQDWMLLMIVLVFVVIDLIILITYTVVAWTMYDEGLVAQEIINSENPEDLKGVSKCHIS